MQNDPVVASAPIGLRRSSPASLATQLGQLAEARNSWLLGLLLVVICLPALVLRLGSYPAAWHDEGSRTNAARTLADRGVFGTTTSDGLRPFDPYITSGPVDVVAAALGYKLLGASVAAIRLAMLPFALLAILSLVGAAAYAYGARVGLLAALLVVALPALDGVSLLLLGRQVLGEVPSLALIVAGVYLWFLAWRVPARWWLSALAGIVIGLGLLSKTSIGLALLPALGLVAVGRWWVDKSRWLQMAAPLVLVLAVLAGWRLLEFALTPPAVYAQDMATLSDAIRTLILLKPGWRVLSGSGLLLTAVMLAGALGGLWRLLRAGRPLRLASDAQWADLTLALIAGCYGLWYALLSMGWPRYAFFGFIVALLPLARTGWDLLQRFDPASAARPHGRWQQPVFAGALAFACIALGVKTVFVARQPADDAAAQVADYVNTHIPPQAVIETWAWELDALTAHWQFHHPAASYEYLADRELFADHNSFQLNYDLLKVNPDYLITDAFSDWTNIYDARLVQQNFVLVAEYGAYRIYQRDGYQPSTAH